MTTVWIATAIYVASAIALAVVIVADVRRQDRADREWRARFASLPADRQREGAETLLAAVTEPTDVALWDREVEG